MMLGCNAVFGQHAGVLEAGCPKTCDGTCGSLDDPLFGCAQTACTPCGLGQASSKCVAGACAIAACAPEYDDLNGDPTDGCESPNPLAFGNGTLAVWLRADRGVVM